MKYSSKLSIQILLSVSFLMLSACSQIDSSEVDASSIYGELRLSRSEASSNVTASASLFVGGSTGTVVRLESPASVTINGQSTSEVTDIVKMISYQQTVPVSAGLVTIVYLDKAGTSFKNTLQIPGSFSLALPGSASKAAGLNLSYSTDVGFLPGESIEVNLESGNSMNMVHGSLVTGATTGTLNVSTTDLNELTPGNLTVSICRSSRPNVQAPFPKGADAYIESCSNSKTVTLNN